MLCTPHRCCWQRPYIRHKRTTLPICNANPTWSSTLSTLPTLPEALDDAITRLTHTTSQPHLALVFVSSLYGTQQLQQLVPHLTSRLPSLQHVFGSTVIYTVSRSTQGYGVIASPKAAAPPCEVEQEPALSLTLAHLPSTNLTTAHVTTIPDADAPPSAWHALLGTPSANKHLNLLLLADPTYAPLTDLLAGLDYAYPGASILGGLSSADLYDFNRRALLCWSRNGNHPPLSQHGAAVLSLSGGVDVRPVVSQGCRPLGSAVYTVEQVMDNVVLLVSVGTQRATPKPPLEHLKHALACLPEADRAAASRNLLAGLLPFVGSEPLVRPIIGVVPATGGIALGSDAAVVGRRFQFVIRDAASSEQQLAQRMTDVKRAQLQKLVDEDDEQLLGCVIFSCNGRGSALYGRPHVDARLVDEVVGPLPVAGLQCSGEVGPVGGQTQLLGFSCAIGLVHAV